ncbi:MAG TPA: hypothetical protein PLP29_20085 [Candidatus Ozemobacteraceae bacterium]|nr:hypothetical protein [Candidatus Ozemobacteraceae bacterium]
MTFLHRFFQNREFLLTAIGQVTQFVTTFAFIKLVSHTIPVGEYGIYSLGISISAFIAGFPFSALDQGMARYVSIYGKKGELKSRIGGLFVFYAFLLVLYFLLFLFLLPVAVQTWGPAFQGVAWSVFIYSVLNILRNAFLNIENFRRRRDIVAGSRMFEGIFRILLLLTLLSWWRLDASSILDTASGVFFLNLLYLAYANRNDISFNRFWGAEFWKTISEIFVFSLPLIIWGGFYWIQSMSGIWIIKYFHSPDLVGHFSMLNNLAAVLPVQLGCIILGYLSPIVYEMENRETGSGLPLVRKYLAGFSAIIVIMTLVLGAWGQRLILLVSNDRYLEFSWVLPVLFASSGLFNIALVSTVTTFAQKRPQTLLAANIVPAFVATLAGLWLIRTSGMNGAVSASVMATTTYAFLTFRVTGSFSSKVSTKVQSEATGKM